MCCTHVFVFVCVNGFVHISWFERLMLLHLDVHLCCESVQQTYRLIRKATWKRGKHVTKRFFPSEHTLSDACVLVCIVGWWTDCGVHRWIFVCGKQQQRQQNKKGKKNTCVFPLQHIAMTLRARYPCEQHMQVIYTNTFASTWLYICVRVRVRVAVVVLSKRFFPHWTASIQLVLNARFPSRTAFSVDPIFMQTVASSHSCTIYIQTDWLIL